VKYLDPDKKSVIQDKKQADIKASGSTKKENIRVEEKKQAERIAGSQKLLNEMKEFQASLVCVGIPDLYAGGKVEVQGFGRFDRTYYIATATHRFTRNGYETELKLLKG
jgi:phage protein D